MWHAGWTLLDAWRRLGGNPARTRYLGRMSAPRHWLNEQRARCGVAALCGVLFGLSAFWSGFYSSALWSVASLVFLAAALAFVVATRERPSATALAAVGGLTGLWLWSLVSRGWADRADLALVAANRWALYAAIMTALVLLVGRDRRVASALVGACAAASWGIAVYLLVAMLLPGAQGLFLGINLNNPIGYANGQANLLLLGFWPLVAVAEDARHKLRSALAIGGATVIGALLLAAQRRGSLLALVVSGLLLLALVPGRRTRLWILVAVVAGVGVAGGAISPLYQHPDPSGVASVHNIHQAAVAALLAGAGVACVWALTLTVAAMVRGARQGVGPGAGEGLRGGPDCARGGRRRAGRSRGPEHLASGQRPVRRVRQSVAVAGLVSAVLRGR